MNKLLLSTLIVGVILTSSSVNAAPSYTFTDLNMTGQDRSVAYSINNHNQIAGIQSYGANVPAVWEGSSISLMPGFTHYKYANNVREINDNGQVLMNLSSISAVWSITDNAVTVLNSNNNKITQGWDINNSGEIVGFLRTVDRQIVTWASPSAIPIAISQPNDFFGLAINDSGQIAGSINFLSPYQHAAIKDGATFTDLGTLGGNYSSAIDISNTGFVIGVSQMPNGNYRDFLWDGETMEVLRKLPDIGGNTFVQSVNNDGQSVGFVGYGTGNNYTEHALLWNGTKPIDLNDFLDQSIKDDGWVLWKAFDINDNGWIVGEARNTITGRTHAFLLSSDNPLAPVPEPSTYAMLLAGLGLMGFVGRRKNFAD